MASDLKSFNDHELHPYPRPFLSRMLLRGSPLAVLAAFSWIAWLAHDTGLQRRPVGEPPLVEAPALAIKLASDEHLNEGTVAERREVLAMLSDVPPAEPWERLLPPPEKPLVLTKQAIQSPKDATETSNTVANALRSASGTNTQEPPPATSIATAAAVTLPVTSVIPPDEEPGVAPHTTPQPPPTREEDMAALDALLAEVIQQTELPQLALWSTVPDDAESSVGPPAADSPFGPLDGEAAAIIAGRRPPADSVPARPVRANVAALDGSHRIQLAAVGDEADAWRAWDLFQVDHGPLLGYLEPFIERADTLNGVFYRVQIGTFASLHDAEALCNQLKERQTTCFVVRP
jgi:SPOR domain